MSTTLYRCAGCGVVIADPLDLTHVCDFRPCRWCLAPSSAPRHDFIDPANHAAAKHVFEPKVSLDHAWSLGCCPYMRRVHPR